ncbi:death domain-containing protein CRADD [Synchiropus picturatus]
MDPVHQTLLRRNRLYLSEHLEVSDTIVPFLYQEGILTFDHVENVEAPQTNRKKCMKLLDILPCRGPTAFATFLRSLDDYSWVRDKLVQDLESLPGGNVGTGDWKLPDSVLMKVPSDQELSRLASVLGGDWEVVILDLGVSENVLYRCRANHSCDIHGAALAALIHWRQSQGKQATVQKLVLSLAAAGVHPSVLRGVLCDTSL